MLLTTDNLAIRARLFRGLGDPSRLALLEALRHGERSVTDLVAHTGLTQSNTSMHLACLRDCGLVTARSHGRYVMYSLADPGVPTLLDAADQLLAVVGECVSTCARLPGGAA